MGRCFGTFAVASQRGVDRARLVREGHLTQEQAATFEHRHVVLNAIGTRAEPHAEFARHPIEASDRIAVATAGADLFYAAVRRSVQLTGDPDAAAAQVCERASQKDDAACVVFFV